MLRPSRLLPILAMLFAVALAPSATAKVTIGISDNKPKMFQDENFQALGLANVRIVVPWDGLSYSADRNNLDIWMQGAKARNAKVLLAFDRSRHGKKNPTAKKLASSLKAILKRYPRQIATVTTWNETNINEKNKPPKLVAQWYKALIKIFPRTKVIAADTVDVPSLSDWTKRYLKELKKQRVPTPKFWGLHNYVDVNNFTDKRTRGFLKIVKGNVWLTETGGVVERNNGSAQKFRGKGPQHAADATNYLLTSMLRRNPRIKYVFLYHWNSDEPSDIASWDSSLISSDGAVRPAYDVVKKFTSRNR